MSERTIRADAAQLSRNLWGLLPDKETLVGWTSVTPVGFLYLVITIIPITFATYASLHDIGLLNPAWEFVGLENYGEVLALDQFWASLWRGTVYMVVSTLLQLITGVYIALVLNRIAFVRRIVTTIVFTAYLIPIVVIALAATMMFDPFVGVFHIIGSEWLGLWGANKYALGSKTWAMPLVILIGSWKYTIFISIFTLAQLRSIPDSYYQVAKVVGANKWEMFRDITLPRIKGVLLVAILLRSIFMFNKFDIWWMLTKGGPGYSTTTLPVLAYRQTFIEGYYGLGNSIAVVMFVFLAIGGILYFRLFNPSEEVET